MQKTQDDPGVHRDAASGRAAAPEVDAEELDAELEANAGLEIDPEDLQPKPWVLPDRRRVLLVAGIVLVLLLLVVLPPLISVNRFRHRIAQSVSESLGRPVRIDNVAVNMVALPGFTQ
jgi:hypothetical protein